MTTATQRRLTLDEYHRMIDAGELDDRQVELLNGEIVEMAPEGTPHAAYSQSAGDYLRSLLGSRVRIREAKPITLPPSNSEPEPDIAIVEPHPVAVYVQHHPYPNDVFWLIEYSDSSLKKDTEVKPQTYAAAGIREYWVVNLQKMKLTVYRTPTPTGYQSEQDFTQGTIAPLAFQDVAIDVQRLLS